MNQDNKYSQLLYQIFQASQEEDEKRLNSQFASRLDSIIEEIMNIPFRYSKYFEDFIKQHVQIICNSQNNIQTFMYWKSLFEKLQKANRILTNESAELLICAMQLQIDELKCNKKKVDVPKFEVYNEHVNQSVKQIKLSQSEIDRQQQNVIDYYQQQYYQNNNYQMSSNNTHQSIKQNIPNQGVNYFQQDFSSNTIGQDSEIFKDIPQKLTMSKVRMQGIQETNQRFFESKTEAYANYEYNPKIIIANIDLMIRDDNQIESQLNQSDEIDRKMYDIYKKRILEQKKKKDMITMLNYVLNVIYKQAVDKYSDKVVLKAHLFGSFLQGTCLRNDSDIDVILLFENINISYKKSLYFILSAIQNKLSDEFRIEHVINKFIRIPFINIQHIQTGIKIDIIYENQLGILNSHLFQTYLNIHIKIKVLSVLFKIWADKNQIKGRYKLTSYALLNIVIFFLICNQYIRSLQDCNYFQFYSSQQTINTYCKLERVCQQVYTSFETDKQKIKQKLAQDNYFQKLESKPLHQLFVELIRFCQDILQYNINSKQEKIIITTRPQIKEIRGDLIQYQQEKMYISIQDPFDNEYNPGQRKSFNPAEFNRALNLVPKLITNIQLVEQLFG
ncbi:hypothetical protein ABPG74_011462 [Tetrahymena malaccensis]